MALLCRCLLTFPGSLEAVSWLYGCVFPRMERDQRTGDVLGCYRLLQADRNSLSSGWASWLSCLPLRVEMRRELCLWWGRFSVCPQGVLLVYASLIHSPPGDRKNHPISPFLREASTWGEFEICSVTLIQNFPARSSVGKGSRVDLCMFL